MRYFKGENGWIIFNEETSADEILMMLITENFKVAKTKEEAKKIIEGGK